MNWTCSSVWCAVILMQFSTIGVLSNVSHDGSYQISPAKKYKKKLRKEDGAIRLVGGSNDYEGK